MKKTVETSETPDGRFIYQIGEVDDMGGGFGCLFIDKSSGSWARYDENGKRVSRPSLTAQIKYTGEFFPTRKAALDAGRKTI